MNTNDDAKKLLIDLAENHSKEINDLNMKIDEANIAVKNSTNIAKAACATTVVVGGIAMNNAVDLNNFIDNLDRLNKLLSQTPEPTSAFDWIIDGITSLFL